MEGRFERPGEVAEPLGRVLEGRVTIVAVDEFPDLVNRDRLARGMLTQELFQVPLDFLEPPFA